MRRIFGPQGFIRNYSDKMARRSWEAELGTKPLAAVELRDGHVFLFDGGAEFKGHPLNPRSEAFLDMAVDPDAPVMIWGYFAIVPLADFLAEESELVG